MKKLTVLALLFLTTFISKAQDDNGMHFGLKITPALGWLRTDSKGVESNGTKFAFGYGLITEFKFSDRYSFATGLDVTYRGGNLKSSFETNDGTTRIVSVTESSLNLQYIELPLTLKLKTKEIGYLTYYLQVGVAPGINIRARGDIKSSTQTTVGGNTTNANVELTDEDVQDDINNFNLSMLIGGGIEYTLSGSTVLLVGLQFNNGLLDASDQPDIKMNSNLLGLTVGVLF